MAVADMMPLTGVKWHDRQRKEYDQEKLDQLVESIRRTRGLIQPVVIDPADGSLVAGGRRMRAYMVLMTKAEVDRGAGRWVPDDGWQNIPFVYKGQEDELFRQVCELEENVARVDLEWWEKAAAIAKIDELQRKIAEANGEVWNMRKTAEMAGVSVGTVQQSIQLVEAAKVDPEIKKEETLTGALRKVDTKKKLEQRQKELDRKAEGKSITFPAQIIVGDSAELIKQEADETYDCIVTNFPFGVEYGYSGKADAVYKDDEDYIVSLVRGVVKESYRVLKNDSWMFAFFDIRKCTYSNPLAAFMKEAFALISRIEDAEKKHALMEMGHKAMGLAHWFEEAGFDYVRLMPIIWAKPNKTQGNIGDPRKGMVVAYEAAIIAGKGDPVLLKQGRQDILVHDTLTSSERDFAMQMPVPLCKEIISLLTLGKGNVLDPFAGVGSFGEGALENQCSFRGYELNPERAATGNLRLREHVFAAAPKEG